MRFAVKTMPEGTSWRDLLAFWQLADEDPMWESAWTFDHFYPVYGAADGPSLEGWTTLAALAQATRRIRVGVLVSGVPYRHPAVLANMAAAVDHVSGGRLELGLGAGWHEGEAGGYGIALGSLTERFDRFDEACEVISRLLTEPTTTFSGRYYSLTDARCEPKGVQRPHPPICIGGGGEKRTLRAVARWAQHWNLGGGTVADWQRKRDVLAGHCADAGTDRGAIRTSVHLLDWPANRPDELARQAEQWAEAGMDLGIAYLMPPYDAALLERVGAALRPLG